MKSFRDERRDKLCLDVFFRPINISKSALLHSVTWCQIEISGFKTLRKYGHKNKENENS